MFFSTILGIFYGVFGWFYYFIPLAVFVIISLLYLTIYIRKRWKRKKSPKEKYIAIVLVNILSIFFSYILSNGKDMILMPKEKLFQYKYAAYIKQFDHPTLLNMGFLDAELFEHYQLVFSDPITYEGYSYSALLFQLKKIPIPSK